MCNYKLTFCIRGTYVKNYEDNEKLRKYLHVIFLSFLHCKKI